MERFYIVEDNQASRFRVILSKDIRTKISIIHTYNQNNNKALSQWYEYIEGIVNYISNPSIAWDYANQHTVYKNGTRFMSTFNYNVGYSVKTNANGAYVYIFQVNLNPEAFGLKVPPSLRESKHISKTIRLTETEFKQMLVECITKIINETSNVSKKEFKCKQLGNYTAIDGEWMIMPYKGLEMFDRVQDVRMYDNNLRCRFNEIFLCENSPNTRFKRNKMETSS